MTSGSSALPNLEIDAYVRQFRVVCDEPRSLSQAQALICHPQTSKEFLFFQNSLMTAVLGCGGEGGLLSKQDVTPVRQAIITNNCFAVGNLVLRKTAQAENIELPANTEYSSVIRSLMLDRPRTMEGLQTKYTEKYQDTPFGEAAWHWLEASADTYDWLPEQCRTTGMIGFTAAYAVHDEACSGVTAMISDLEMAFDMPTYKRP